MTTQAAHSERTTTGDSRDGDGIGYDYEGWPFPAYDDRGSFFALTPLYRRRTSDGRPAEPFVAEACVGLRTDAGERVVRLGPGRYAVEGTGETLTSRHRDAV